MTEAKRSSKFLRIAGFFCMLIGGILILLDGYYWSIDPSFAQFIWSGAVTPTAWSSTGHIPLFYWGVTCGALVILGAVLTIVPNDNAHFLGGVLAVVFSIVGVVASGGWMMGFVLGLVGSLLAYIAK